MEHFSLVLSGPQKGQLSYIQNHEKVAEVSTVYDTRIETKKEEMSSLHPL